MRLRSLRGGLQAAGVFRVQAQLRSPAGRLQSVQFVAQRVHGALRRGATGVEPVLLDWARARPGSALEDVSAWVQSLGQWEPQARRGHDTLVRTYLVARGLEPVLPRDFRRLYWVAGACNALAGALRYHLLAVAHARTPTQQAKARTLVQQWLRVIRRADASWRAG